MPAVPIFHGQVDEHGKLMLSHEETESRAQHLRGLVGQRVEIVIRKERGQRSLAQNAYLHSQVFPLLATEFCDSVEGVKFDLMGEKWGWTKTNSGHHIPVKPHTSDMTVEECSEVIDWVIPWAMTMHGVRVPLPNESEAA